MPGRSGYGGNLNVRAIDYYQSQAVGPNGALVGAAEWLAGEKVASVVIKGGAKILAPVLVKSTSKVVAEVAVKEISVIGPRNTYREFAKKIGAHFLDVTDDVGAWTWRKNKNFLREVVARGDDVIFAGKFNPSELNPNSILAREINFLTERGYSWVEDFSKLVKK